MSRQVGLAARGAFVATVLLGCVFGGACGLLCGRPHPFAVSFRRGFVRLGPAFVKLGQLLSVRPDVLGVGAARCFEGLRDNTPALSSVIILTELERSWGVDPEAILARFDPLPVGVGSISQVHRCALASGEEVAVKVRKPYVERVLKRDLLLGSTVLAAVGALFGSRTAVWMRQLWRELYRAAEAELDFRREAEAAERLKRNLKGEPDLFIPAVFWSLTTKLVLVTEWVEGHKLSSEEAKDHPEYERLAGRGAELFFRQVLRDGFFHSDLHPANVLITSAGEIGYVDFGQWGRLSKEDRETLWGVGVGMLASNPTIVFAQLEKLGLRVPEGRRDEVAATGGRLFKKAGFGGGATLAEVDSVGLAGELFLFARRCKVELPHKVALLLKGVATVEGSARVLSPDFVLADCAMNALVVEGRREMRASKLLNLGFGGLGALGLAKLEVLSEPRGSAGQ